MTDDQRESKGTWSKEALSAPGFYWCRQFGRVRMVSVWKYSSATDGRLFTNEDGGAPLDDRELYVRRDVERANTTTGIFMKDDQREAYEERAAILEFDARMTRAEAEKAAAKMVADDEDAEFTMGSDSPKMADS